MTALDPAVEFVLRGALALLLATGAIGKLRDLAAFRLAIDGYELVPARASGAAAVAFAGAEAALAAGLVAPLAWGVRDTALAGGALLFAIYAVAIAINLLRGRREIDCGCSATAAHIPLSGWLVARNALLIAAAWLCRGAVSARPLTLVDAVTVAAAIAVLACVWSALHGLLAYEAELTRVQEDV